jgi:hypothetical protein
LLPEVANETWVLLGLFLVTSVGFVERSTVVQVTEESHADSPSGIVHGIADMVPSGSWQVTL